MSELNSARTDDEGLRSSSLLVWSFLIIDLSINEENRPFFQISSQNIIRTGNVNSMLFSMPAPGV